VRPLIIAAAALAVFLLAIVMLSTSAMPAPATPAADHCLLCHPQPHSTGWLSAHASDIADKSVSTSTCTQCHTTAECDACHAQSGISAGSGDGN